MGGITPYDGLAMEFEFKYLGEWLYLAIQSSRDICIKVGVLGQVLT